MVSGVLDKRILDQAIDPDFFLEQEITISPTMKFYLDTAGSILPVLLFIAPGVGILKIIQLQNSEILPSLQFTSMLLNCVLWSMFGFLLQEGPIIIPNGCGTILSLIYIAAYYIYSKDPSQLKKELSLVFLLLIFGFFLSQQFDDNYVGSLAAGASVAMLAAPLVQFNTVIKTRDTTPLGPFVICVVGWLCSFTWFIQGWFILNKRQIWVANGLGNLSANCTLALFGIYGFAKDQDPMLVGISKRKSQDE